MPREILLNKVPFPLPTPEIFNLDQILAATTDTVVSENGEFKEFSLWLVIFPFPFLSPCSMIYIDFYGGICSFDFQ
jgi:hypothetical protein